jgi:cysteine synthase
MDDYIDYDGRETLRLLRAGQQEALPSLLSHTPHLHALGFDVMKHLPAYYMIEHARQQGILPAGGPVVETSSGTFAIGLARVCRDRHPCHIVTDKAVDADLKAALEALGTQVEIVDAARDAANLQELRKRRRDEIAQELGAFIPNQYDNPANPDSYRAAAEIAINRLGRVDILVATVGSGGSSAGMGGILRLVNPALRVVAVDTFGSVLFGLPAGPRRLRGLGNSLLPRNVRHDTYDEVHWVTEDVALEGVLRIQEAGLGDRGLTSGAAWIVADHCSRIEPDAVVLAIFPDMGWRYRATVADYRLRRSSASATLPPAPQMAANLAAVSPPWSRLDWRRRGLAAIRAAATEGQP